MLLQFKISVLNVFMESLQSLVSQDPSEIILIWWFAAQETFLIIINVKNVVLLNIFVENVILSFFQDSLMNRTLKSTAFI